MMHPHRPPHILQSNSLYFITASTWRKEKFFDNSAKLMAFTSLLQKNVEMYSVKLEAWIVLLNHYHLIANIQDAKILPRFIRKLHSDSAIFLNKFDNIHNRRIWYQYWERIIRSERDFYIRVNYIHNNCIKHGIVKEMGDYKFSSYGNYLETEGKEWVEDCFRKYPIIDFIVDEEVE